MIFYLYRHYDGESNFSDNNRVTGSKVWHSNAKIVYSISAMKLKTHGVGVPVKPYNLIYRKYTVQSLVVRKDLI